jgi:acyl-CoA synthetase (NDP forming)
MAHYLDPVLNPRSIAIIGASKDPAKRGYRAIQSLFNDHYQGKILPINPKESEILGLACYPAIEDVPGEVDVALVCTAAKTVPAVMEACGRKGVKGAILLAGGFGEASEAGRLLEEETVEIARRYNVRFIGPNTNGMFSARLGCNAIGVPDIPRGPLALLSNSANVNVSALTAAQYHGYFGISTMLSVGNQSGIQFHEYIECFGEDPDVRSIVSYIEGFKNGPAYLAAARKVTPVKPIVMYVAGRNAEGRRAAKSHSGSLAGDYEVSKGVLPQAGVTIVTRMDELYPVAEALALLPPMRGPRVAVLSEGGGVITVAAEALVDRRLTLPALTPETQAKIHAIIPNASAISNPVDSGGGTDPRVEYCGSISQAILEDPNVDALLIVGFFGGYTMRYGPGVAAAENKVCTDLADLMHKHGKPVVVQSHYLDFKPESMDVLRKAGVPVQRHIEIAAQCLASAAAYQAARARIAAPAPAPAPPAGPGARDIIGACRREGRDLLEPEAQHLLKAYGIAVPEHQLMRTREDAQHAARIFGDVPLAVKVVSRDVLHKSDAGGVKLNVRGAAALESAFDEIQRSVLARHPQARIEGMLVTPMAEAGTELIVGVTRDPQYGPVLMLGLGGVFVEVIRDVVFRSLPISALDAQEMLNDLRYGQMLDGARGTEPVDRQMIADLLVNVSAFATAHPELVEIDLNPVIARGHDYSIVDARMILTDKE